MGKARLLDAGLRERCPHGPHDQVALARGGRGGALAGDLDAQAGLGDLGGDLVVAGQRQAEGVEAGPQVGAGGGDPYPDSVARMKLAARVRLVGRNG